MQGARPAPPVLGQAASSDARQIASAWRELRRIGAAQETRKRLFGPETPLDPGQADALDYVVTGGPCRMGDLAAAMRVDPSAATRAVDRLELDGLVERAVDPRDGRRVIVAITERGAALHAQVSERAHALLDEVLANFSDSERRQLAQLMLKLAEEIDRVARRAAESAG